MQDDDEIHAPWRDGSDKTKTDAKGLSIGAVGSGANKNDTGGLDGAGNELGAATPGGTQGHKESDREDEAIANTALTED